MATMPLPIDSGYNIQPETQIASEITINMYVSESATGTRRTWLRPMRGRHLLETFTSATSGRATYVLDDSTAYAVVGNGFFRIDSFFNITRLGTLNTQTGYAKIVANQLLPVPQLLIIDGSKGYYWDGVVFGTITSDGFPLVPIDADYMDGRFLVADGDTNEWTISDINNVFDWLAADSLPNTETINSRGDIFSGLGVLHRRVYLFGKKSMESWYDAGAPQFPFAKDNNFAVDFGLQAVGTKAVAFNMMFFLASTDEGAGYFMRITDASYYPEKISTKAIEFLISTLTNPNDGMSYITKTADGHIQYITSFTTDNITLVYDNDMDRWYVKQALDGGRDIAQVHFYLNGKHCTIGYNNNKLYEESDDFSDDDGLPIRRLWRSPVIADEGFNRVRLDRLRVAINQLMGDFTTPDSLLKLFLRFSGDGGVTFKNAIPVTIRDMGEFQYLPTFRRIGKGRLPVIELEHVSKAKFSIIGLSLDFEILPD
jgi:hypothetical protein